MTVWYKKKMPSCPANSFFCLFVLLPLSWRKVFSDNPRKLVRRAGGVCDADKRPGFCGNETGTHLLICSVFKPTLLDFLFESRSD
ncbi:hypothetical protein RRG08_031224 [Elysia crispata]|uniref:Uncharacterized protein n=1 Tax=Elysia crispata TaxID=231223 RepID=A0AAE1AJ34_9GAST|nr:hypothetical protein RRG08_031224 [Elysia crispata]